MKVALVHDYIKEYGGAERVLEALHELYPDAPVFTTVYIPEFLGPHKERFKDWDIRTSFLQRAPFKHKLISLFRIISPLVFKLFDFSQYDIIIVSATGAYIPNTIRITPHPVPLPQGERGKRKVIHVCYCHTPPRYLYGYATARDWQKNSVFRVIGAIGNHILRIVDYNASKNVDYYIANSQEVAGRIKKFYRREAKVIYPPVEISNITHSTSSGQEYQISNIKSRKYFLAGGRLARPKHIDLIVRVCAELNVPLKVFGKGFAGYGEELEKISNIKYQISNIQFLGEVTDEEKQELMRNAKAFIFASEDEDFGITPVEVMAAGTPVIAYRSGGVKETIIDGKTGIFFNELTVESLSKATKRFNALNHFSREACMKQAEKFSIERFRKEIKEFVKKGYQEKLIELHKVHIPFVESF